MCDYSLEHVDSRPAIAGETLTVRSYGHTKGFAGGDPECVTCVKEGTKLSLELAEGAEEVTMTRANTQAHHVHHDAIIRADGSVEMLQALPAGTKVVVLGGYPVEDPDAVNVRVVELARE
jgi:hypothetical protein